jgi:hypothetical protein
MATVSEVTKVKATMIMQYCSMVMSSEVTQSSLMTKQ